MAISGMRYLVPWRYDQAQVESNFLAAAAEENGWEQWWLGYDYDKMLIVGHYRDNYIYNGIGYSFLV